MATDATGTPTNIYSIPKYNTSVDRPSGLGFNNAMDFIDNLLNGAFIYRFPTAGVRNTILAANGTTVPLTCQLSAGTSTASIQEWKNSAGNIVAKIWPSGVIHSHIGFSSDSLASATTPGSVIAKIAVYDSNGNFYGYLPVYNTIT